MGTPPPEAGLPSAGAGSCSCCCCCCCEVTAATATWPGRGKGSAIGQPPNGSTSTRWQPGGRSAATVWPLNCTYLVAPLLAVLEPPPGCGPGRPAPVETVEIDSVLGNGVGVGVAFTSASPDVALGPPPEPF